MAAVYIWTAAIDDDGDSFDIGGAVSDAETDDGGTTVNVALRVKDEVTQTVEDGLSVVCLAGLTGVRMVADQCVGTSVH